MKPFLTRFAGGVKTQMALDFSNIHADMEKMTPGVRAMKSLLLSINTGDSLDHGPNQGVHAPSR